MPYSNSSAHQRNYQELRLIGSVRLKLMVILRRLYQAFVKWFWGLFEKYFVIVPIWQYNSHLALANTEDIRQDYGYH